MLVWASSHPRDKLSDFHQDSKSFRSSPQKAVLLPDGPSPELGFEEAGVYSAKAFQTKMGCSLQGRALMGLLGWEAMQGQIPKSNPIRAPVLGYPPFLPAAMAAHGERC